MPEIIEFGPFMMKSEWLLLIISGCIGYFIMQRLLKKSGKLEYLSILDKTVNCVLLIFICWKLSPIIFNPAILWQNPLGLLFLPGSVYGVWLGLLVAGLYLIRELRRINISFLFYSDLLTIGAVTMILIYQLLGWRYGSITSLPWGVSIEDPSFKYHPVNIYVLLITLPMVYWVYKNRFSLGKGKLVQNFFSYYTIGLMLISFTKTKVYFMFGLSEEQVAYLMMMLISFIMSMLLQRNKNSKLSEEERNDLQHDTSGKLPSNSGNASSDEIRTKN